MPYPHKLSPDQILDEAARMVDEHGLACISTRHLAERLDARAPSLYRYFPDKESLIAALSVRFLDELAATLAPHHDLIDLGRAYWDYARRHPWRYEAIVRRGPDGERVSFASARPALVPLLALARRVHPERPEPLAWAIWSYLHGAVGLFLTVETAADADRDEAFLLGLTALSRGIAAG